MTLTFVACSSAEGEPAATSSADSPVYQGSILAAPLRKPDFRLTDTSGEPYSFAAETEGYVTLVYFGFTNCPDVCPDHMNNIDAALESLPSDVSDRVKVVLITIDPDRDTPERLREWLDLFSPSFVGLTGSFEAIDSAMQRSLGDFYVPVIKEELATGYYSSTHANFVLAYTTDNYAHIVYPFGVRQDTWEHDLETLVEDGWRQPRVTSTPVPVETAAIAGSVATPSPGRPQRLQAGEAKKLLTATHEEATIEQVREAVTTAFELHPDASRFMSQGLTIPQSRLDLDLRICGSKPEGVTDSLLLACSTLQGCTRLVRVLYDFYVQSGYEEFYVAALSVYRFVATSLPQEFEAFYKILRAELRVANLPAE
jgi:protein SCO1/2